MDHGSGMAARLATIRRTLAAIFLFGSLGAGAELVLMDHTEGVWQNVPLVLLAIGCGGLGMVATTRGTAQLRAFQLVMMLFVASGVAGVVLHYQGNVEFELELNPDASGMELFRESMKGATPALAPGTMILLGAVGLGYAYLIEPE
ncbi:MAG TPA: hypothetical protein VIK60_13000 [Vicinamibacterales bacterium]